MTTNSLLRMQGVYPRTFDWLDACKWAYAYATVTKAKRVTIGGDYRDHVPKMLGYVSTGLGMAGCKAITVGQGTLEKLTYHACSQYTDGMLYVSGHNGPLDYTGIRMLGPDGNPIPPSVMDSIAEIVDGAAPKKFKQTDGAPMDYGLNLMDYEKFVGKIIENYGAWPPETTGFVTVVDGGISKSDAAMNRVMADIGVADNVKVFSVQEIDKKPMKGTNPFDPARIARVEACMKSLEANLGILFSADGSQIAVLDEEGYLIHGSHLGAYLAAAVGQRWRGEPLLVDQRAVLPMLSTAQGGGSAFAIGLPGDDYMRATMRSSTAAFGAAMEGRYYFREFWWSPSGLLAAMLTMHMAYLTPKPLGEVISDMMYLFPVKGEVPYKVADVEDAMTAVMEGFANGGEKCLIETVNDELVVRGQGDADWRLCLRPDAAKDRVLLTVEGRGGLTYDDIENLHERVASYMGL